MKNILIILNVLVLLSGCSSFSRSNRRAPASEVKPVEVFLIHDFAEFKESNSDENLHVTSLGMLKTAEELVSDDIRLVTRKDNQTTTLLIDQFSVLETIDVFNEQLKNGRIEIHAKGQNYKNMLLASEFETNIDGLDELLEFEKEHELSGKNLNVKYEHKFSYREVSTDQNLQETYLGSVYKIKFRERGPDISWNTLTVYSKFEKPEILPKTLLFGLIGTGKTRMNYESIESICEITMEAPGSYDLMRELLSHDKSGDAVKNIVCTDERYIWEDFIRTDLAKFNQAREFYRAKLKKNINAPKKKYLFESGGD